MPKSRSKKKYKKKKNPNRAPQKQNGVVRTQGGKSADRVTDPNRQKQMWIAIAIAVGVFLLLLLIAQFSGRNNRTDEAASGAETENAEVSEAEGGDTTEDAQDGENSEQSAQDNDNSEQSADTAQDSNIATTGNNTATAQDSNAATTGNNTTTAQDNAATTDNNATTAQDSAAATTDSNATSAQDSAAATTDSNAKSAQDSNAATTSNNTTTAQDSAAATTDNNAMTTANSAATAPDTAAVEYADIVVQDYGTITVELDPAAAPVTVQNFTNLVKDGFYNGLTFHRIMDGFMIQGGDPLGNGTGGSSQNIVGEFESNGYANSISHVRGTISMARASGDNNSASSQFFIVQTDSAFLDGDYAAFGHVTSGMEVVDRICKDAKPIDNNGSIAPEEQPVIESITIREQ